MAKILKTEKNVESKKSINISPYYYEGKIRNFLRRIARSERLDSNLGQARSYFLNLAEFGKEKAREILEKEKEEFKKKKNNS